MSHNSPDLRQTNWTGKLSFEVALYTLLLNAILSLFLNHLLESLSDGLKIQILGSPIGTTIMGISELLLVIPLLAYSRRHRINRFQLGMDLGNWRQTLADTAIGVIVGLTMVPVSLFASTLNQVLLGPQPEAEYISNSFTASSAVEVFLLLTSIILVVAPIEEVIVRGFVQQGFERSHGKLKGLVIASFIFSIMHLSPWSIFPLFTLGMILGFTFQMRHGRILAPIASHASYMVYVVISLSY